MNDLAYGSITISDLNTITEVRNWYLATNASSNITKTTSGWTTTIQTIDENKQYLWNYEENINGAGEVISSTLPIIIGRYGKDGVTGKGIKNITEYYCASASTTAPGDSSFSTTVQTASLSNPYLWNYEVITYTDNSIESTDKRIIGVYGATGASVTEVKILYYLKSNTTAPNAPTSEVTSTSTSSEIWTTAVPTYVSGYSYFTCVQTKLSSGTSPKWSSPVLDRGLTDANKNAAAAASDAASAIDTANNAIKATVSCYYRSTSSLSNPNSIKPTTNTSIGTSATTSNAWEYVMPQPKKNEYFYTCEKYTHTDNSVSFSDVCEIANATYTSKWVSSADNVYIDGGALYANSVTADRLNANDINASGILTIGALDTATNTAINNGVSAYNRATAIRGVCSTTATTAAKVVTADDFMLEQGATIVVYNTTAQTVANKITLDVNSTGAKDVYVGGAVTSASNQILWAANSSVAFTYDGTRYRVQDSPGSWIPTTGTQCTVAAGTAAKTIAINEIVVFKGASVTVPMQNENTAASPTLNVTSLGAKNIYSGNTSLRPTTANGRGWIADTTVVFTFDGQYWHTGGQTIINGDNIKTGTIDADRIKANVISAINDDSNDGLIISADRVNIAGATVFSNYATKTEAQGYASSAESNAKDAIPTNISELNNDSKYQTSTQVDTAISTATSDMATNTSVSNTYATKNTAAAEEQYIYISKALGTTSVSANTTWVTANSDSQNTWTTKRPTYSSSYPVLFIAKQKKTVSGTVTCTTPVKDDTTTVIDGGNIITGTVTANALNALDINASKSLTVGAMTDAAAETILNSNIKIGGTNLITGTNSTTSLASTANATWTKRGWRSAGSASGVTKTSISVADCPNNSVIHGWNFTADSITSNTYGSGGLIGQNSVPILPNTEYTLSCYAKGTGRLLMFYGVSSFGPVNGSGRIDVNNTSWIKYYITFTTESGTNYVSASNTTNIFFGIGYGTNIDLSICGMKLEIGNKATDWTPAPEDVDADISDAAKTATNYITDIDSNKGITIKPSDSSDNDYLQINPDAISFYRNNVATSTWTDTEAIIGQVASGKYNTRISASGMQIRNNTTVLSEFGSNTITLGNTSDYNLLISTNKLSYRYGTGNNLFSITTNDTTNWSTATITMPRLTLMGTNSDFYADIKSSSVGFRFDDTISKIYLLSPDDGSTITAKQMFKVGSEKSATVSSIAASNGSGVNITIDSLSGYTPVAVKSVRNSQLANIACTGWYFSSNTVVRIGYKNLTTSAYSNVVFYVTVFYVRNELL